MSAYSDHISLYDGHCVIYIRSNSKKGLYQCRLSFPGRKGYTRRSLKTSSRNEAIALAQSLYLSLRARIDQSLPIDASPWVKLAEQFLQIRSTDRKANSFEYTYVFENFLTPFFGDFEDVTDINDTDIARYWDYRINYWSNHNTTPRAAKAEREVTNKKPYSREAARREAIILRSFFDWLFSRGYIGKKPRIKPPKDIQHTTNSRGRFSIPDYRLLLRRLEAELRKKPSPDRVRYHLPRYRRLQRLRYWILLLSGSGIRPAEAKLLKQKQITLLHDKASGHQFTQIQLYREQSKNKRASRSIITFDNELNYHYYQRYLAVLADYDPNLIGPDKWVFPSFRDKTQYFDYKSAFKILLKTFDLYRDDEGRPRSSYSLRSFYISRRLEAGCPLYTVAMNCGTSYEQIHRHYASSLIWTMRNWLTTGNLGQHLPKDIEPQPEAKDIFKDLAPIDSNLSKTYT